MKIRKLPENWRWTTLGNIAELVGGGTPSREHPEYFRGNVVWLTPTEIPRNCLTIISTSREKITEDGLRRSSARILPKGTVLMTSRASIGYVAIAGTEVTTNQGFASFICKNEVNNHFLAYWLLGNADYFIEQATGTTFKEITKSKLRSFSFPLPQLPEQERIVAKIEELFTQLEAGTAALKRVQAGLKRYKAAVLKAAVEGRLVDGGSRMRDVGEDELPEGWRLERFDIVTTNFDGKRVPVKASDRDSMEGEYPYYGASGIIDFVNDYLFDGDYLLIAEDGANLFSRTTPIAFQAHGKFWVNNHAHIVKTLAEMQLTFLEIFINALDLQFYITGTAQPKLTQANLNKVLVPVPPLAEQYLIVAEVERRLSVTQEIESVVEASLKRAGRLRQAVLKAAFEGRLV